MQISQLPIFAVLMSFLPMSASAQSSTDVYRDIKITPSPIRWCLPGAGDDPAEIIGHVCHAYHECLSNVDLDESVDQKPFPNLSAERIEDVKKCHQAVYNAAHVNPQIKGSGATQHWLQDEVQPGTQAKSFPIPGITSVPR